MFQRSWKGFWIALVVSGLAGSAAGFYLQESDKPRKIKRVKRPVFKQRDWEGIYFEDLFRDGLVGPRPNKVDPNQIAKSTTNPGTGDGEVGSTAGGFAWSKYISGATIEDLVKKLQQDLAADITTPSKFKSDYAKVHHSFSILSMLFAIIREYDGDVRWKKDAALAQASFERAAANSRVGTIQAYESCKRRKDDLVDMVRGGNFAGEEKPPEELDWSLVVGHSPIMEELETSFGLLKQNTSSENEFKSNLAEILLRAELVAVLSEAVQKEDMEYAGEDGYVEYAQQMSQAAVSVVKGCQNNDYDAVSQAVNLIGQTCSNCHDDYR